MSVLRFIVTKQKLVEDGQPFVVANSREYLSVAFDFSSAWNDCIKTVVFRKASGETFSVILEEENSCTVPWEVIECPHFTVSVYGICGTERITTNQVVVKVEMCGYEEGKTPEEPTQTVYEAIADQLNSIEKRFENYGTAALFDVGISAGNVPVLNDEGKLEESVLPEETDPIFTASAAFRITDENIESWNTKSTFSGDYNDLTNKPTKLSEFDNDAGYLDTETDPVFTASPAHGITVEDIEKWNSSTGFSGDYNDLTNKPEIPAALTDLTGTLPIEQGGTGGVTAKAAQYNILKVMGNDNSPPSDASEFVFAFPDISASEVDGSVFKRSASRVWDWIASKVRSIFGFNDSNVLGTANGGTGANTVDEALTNLGASKSSDVGDVSTLSTTDKTVVGAINELQAEIGDVETALATIIGGATE